MDLKILVDLLTGHIINTLNRHLNGSVKESNVSHNYETEKNTGKASDAAENLQLYRVVRFFCPRSSCTTNLMFTFANICVEAKGFKMNTGKTKVMCSCSMKDKVEEKGKWPCGVCKKGVGNNSILCHVCKKWIHKRSSGVKGSLQML